jgi:hypothetical protein
MQEKKKEGLLRNLKEKKKKNKKKRKLMLGNVFFSFTQRETIARPSIFFYIKNDTSFLLK